MLPAAERGGSTNDEGNRGRRASTLGSYGLAVLFTALALLLQWFVSPYVQPTPFLPFLAAVMLAGRKGGWGPGLLSTGLSSLAVNFFFLHPLHSLSMSRKDFLSILLFVLLSALITRLNVREQAARAEAEAQRARLYSLFMEAPAPIALIRGPEHVYEFSNPLNTQLSGGRIQVGKTVREALPEMAAAGLIDQLDHIYRSGEPFRYTESPVPVLQENGTLRRMFLNGVIQPTRDAQGRIDGTAAFAFDVTQQVEARQRAEALADKQQRQAVELREALQARDTFLSIASHELKTPLTPLSLKLQALVRAVEADPESSFARRHGKDLEAMQRQIKRLSSLVDSLFDVTRISRGQLRLEPERMDLSALVREVVARFEPQAEQTGCRLEVEASEASPGRWDRLRLEQVISNLLSNALKYGAGKPVHVRVESSGDKARLVVRDEGIGIPPESLGRIFEKFERGVSERHYGGLGLGLYVTRQIVEAMGGTIHVESTLGQGASFRVELPREPPESAASSP